MIEEKNTMTVDELAVELEIKPATLRQHIKRGNLKAKKVGRRWEITEVDARRFTEQYKATPKGFARPDHPHHGKGKPPDPSARTNQGEFTHIYLPCHPDEAQLINRTLPADERLAILRTFAKLKQAGADVEIVLESLEGG